MQMNNMQRPRAFIIVAFCAAAVQASAAAVLDPFAPMKYVPSPQSTAFGETIVSFDNSAAAMLNNPAELRVIYIPKLSLFHTSLAGEAYYSFAGVSIPREWGNIGVGGSYLGYGADARDGTIGADSYSLAGSGEASLLVNAAFPIRQSVPITTEYGSVGFNLKYIHSAVGSDSGDSLVMDAGVVYYIPFLEGLRGSLVLRDLGLETDIGVADRSFGSRASLGLGYAHPRWAGFRIAADMRMNSFGAGVSVMPVYPVTFRLGWRDTYLSPESGIRAGVGLDFNNFSLNYSLSPYKVSYFTHQIGLDIAFGGFSQPRIAYDHYLNSHFEKARNLFEKRDYINARRSFEDILSVYPHHQLSKEYLERIGQALDEIEQQKVIDINQWLRKANVAMFKYDFVRARKYYDFILETDPQNNAALEGLRKIDEMAMEFQREYERESVRRQNRDKILRFYNDAIALFQKGEYVLAKEKFQELLTIDPENSEAEKYIANIDAQLTRISTYQTNELYIKGIEFYEQGNYRDALKYFEAVATAAPHRLDAREYIMECRNKLREEEERLAAQHEARKRDDIKDQVMSLYNRAMQLYESGDYESALKAFTRSKEIAIQFKHEKYIENSKNYIANIRNALAVKHFKIGFEYAQRNKIESAAYEYRKALEYNADYTTARDELDRVSTTLAQQYYEQGMMIFASGDTAKARELFKKSLFYKPDKVESQRALERIK